MLIRKGEEIRSDYLAAKPGTWWKDSRNTIEWVLCLVCCPTCRRVSTVSSEVHSVSSGGVMSPSFVCRQNTAAGAPCTFHEFIQLEGWGS